MNARTRCVGFMLIALCLVACRGGAEPGAEDARRRPSASRVPSYEVHEWGVLVGSLDDAPVRLPPEPLPSTEASGEDGRRAQAPGATGESVLYFHIDEGFSELALSVMVQPAAAGRLLDHFPTGVPGADQQTVRWPSVRLTQGACRDAHATLPSAGCPAGDGRCEWADPGRHASVEADCVGVGEQRVGLLAYRWAVAQAALPLVIGRQREDVISVRQGDATNMPPVDGWVMRVHRVEDRSRTRVRIASIARGRTAHVRPANASGGDGAESGIERLRASVLAGGLDAHEADAFMTAWTDLLFGGEAQPTGAANHDPERMDASPDRPGPSPVRPVTDALVYLLLQESVDALVALEATPAPRVVRRVHLVRVTLAAEPTTLEFEPAVVRGGLSREVVGRVLPRHSPGIQQCVLHAPEGRVELQLRTQPTGAVHEVRVDGVDVGDDARACLLAYGRRITFPPARASATITQPITIRH